MQRGRGLRLQLIKDLVDRLLVGRVAQPRQRLAELLTPDAAVAVLVPVLKESNDRLWC